MSWGESSYECPCGERVGGTGAVEVWMQTGLGLTMIRTHAGCEDRALSKVAEMLPAPIRRVEQPRTKEEKFAAKEADKAAEYQELADRMFD